jgi:FdhD protein
LNAAIGDKREQIVSLEYGETKAIGKALEAGNNIVRARLTGGSGKTEPSRRNFFISSSCGICGKASIEAVMAHGILRPNPNFVLDPKILCTFPDTLKAAQNIFDRTGGLHAAGLFDVHGKLVVLREDVGRHNAVDAIAGQMWLDRIDGGDKIFYTTGRLTSEMVIKCAQMGIPFLVSRSGLTQMGYEVAQKVDITMLGRATGKHYLLFTGKQRFTK